MKKQNENFLKYNHRWEFPRECDMIYYHEEHCLTHTVILHPIPPRIPILSTKNEIFAFSNIYLSKIQWWELTDVNQKVVKSENLPIRHNLYCQYLLVFQPEVMRFSWFNSL